MMRNDFRGRHPVDVGQELDVKIEAAGAKGDGVAKVKGYVLFVPNTKPGDEVHIKVTRVLKSVGFAESLGPATGPVETDAAMGEPAAEEPAEEYHAEAPAPEDSEDFGEEPAEEASEEPAEEAPTEEASEEPAEEAPAEEASEEPAEEAPAEEASEEPADEEPKPEGQ